VEESIYNNARRSNKNKRGLHALGLDVNSIEQEMGHGLFDPSGAFKVIG
jgi:hypothetical protein